MGGLKRQEMPCRTHGAVTEFHQSNASTDEQGDLSIHAGLHEFSVNVVFTLPLKVQIN